MKKPVLKRETVFGKLTVWFDTGALQHVERVLGGAGEIYANEQLDRFLLGGKLDSDVEVLNQIDKVPDRGHFYRQHRQDNCRLFREKKPVVVVYESAIDAMKAPGENEVYSVGPAFIASPVEPKYEPVDTRPIVGDRVACPWSTHEHSRLIEEITSVGEDFAHCKDTACCMGGFGKADGDQFALRVLKREYEPVGTQPTIGDWAVWPWSVVCREPWRVEKIKNELVHGVYEEYQGLVSKQAGTQLAGFSEPDGCDIGTARILKRKPEPEKEVVEGFSARVSRFETYFRLRIGSDYFIRENNASLWTKSSEGTHERCIKDLSYSRVAPAIAEEWVSEMRLHGRVEYTGDSDG